MTSSTGFDGRRRAMVERQIAARGVTDARVLDAMRTVPREAFVAHELADEAYDDRPLPIACGQTISQPYMVAVMAEALLLTPWDRVLEVGAGSGYAAAVMSRLAAEVWSVERLEELAAAAAAACAGLGYGNVHVVHGDGSLGLPAHAPFDAISVACAGPAVPQTLLEQLSPGGRLVMPVGATAAAQELVRVRRAADGGIHRESLGPVRFVPLVGAQGFPDG